MCSRSLRLSCDSIATIGLIFIRILVLLYGQPVLYTGKFRRSAKKVVAEFQKHLEKSGINVTIRREMGADINGACGQLRKSFLEQSDSITL